MQNTKANESSKAKLVTAAGFGNMFENYDFALYGYFAPIIAPLFFPSTSRSLSFLYTFGVFAAGFLMRPLGAMIFGFFGDRIGRKKALSASILMMAVPTTLIGLLPTHQQIGSIAGILLLICRLLQGLAAGGEFTGSIIYIAEHASSNHRGFYTSWVMVCTFVGFLLGSVSSALASNWMAPTVLNTWGWRVPFTMGLLLGIIGLYLRLRTPETPNFLALKAENKILKNPLQIAFKKGFPVMGCVMGLNFLPAVAYYLTFVYLSSYFILYLNISMHIALVINSINMMVAIILMPLIGFLSDKIGRKPIMFVTLLAFIIFSYPLFLLMQQGSFHIILLTQMGFAVITTSIFAVMPAILVESVAADIRYTAISLPYNISSALFGGTLPLVSTFLIEKTSNLISPALYLILSGIVTFLIVLTNKASVGKYRQSLVIEGS